MFMRQMKTSDEDPSDEEEAFKQLPPRKQRVYNEMVEFQKELRQLNGWKLETHNSCTARTNYSPHA